MRVLVVTSLWGAAHERYGHIFLETFNRFWPSDVELVVTTDRDDLRLLRGDLVDLRRIEGYRLFKERWGQDRVANGYDAAPGTKTTETGYSWRHDAVKWMPQGISAAVAASRLRDGDVMVWLDGDVETTAPIPAGWVSDIIGDADVACLQRKPKHSEIGFYAVRINDRTRLAMEWFAAAYHSGICFALKETHSAFVFDRALEQYDLSVKNLTPPGERGHVFPRSVLQSHLSHFKGSRKDSR